MVNSSSVHEIRWREVFPWVILLRAMRAALQLRCLALAVVGVLLTHLGWLGVGRLVGFPEPQSVAAAPGQFEFVALPVQPELGRRIVTENPLAKSWGWCWQGISPEAAHSLQRGAAALLMTGWMFVVWGLVGTALVRIAALYLTRGEAHPTAAAISDAWRSFAAATVAPGIAAAGCVVVSGPLAVAGLLLRFDWTAVIVASLWLVVAAWALGVFLAVVGLLIGWPLMVVSAAVEQTDAFDGVSRGYAYALQRPVHLVGYLLVGGGLAYLANGAVVWLVQSALRVVEYAVGWGAGEQRALAVIDYHGADPDLPARLIRGWTLAIEYAVNCVPMALFWAMATAVYLLLRMQVDQTEMDECRIEQAEPAAGWNLDESLR